MEQNFIDYAADFYGPFSVDEFAERLGVATSELMEYLFDLIDENYDAISEEMGYNKVEELDDGEE